jgi:hypothetical protein
VFCHTQKHCSKLTSALPCVDICCLTLLRVPAVKNKAQFFVLRMLLGVSESGAFPGMW